MNTSTATDLENGLRLWAAGSYPDEAAVELLIRSGWARRTSFVSDCTHPLEGGIGSWIDWETVGQILAGERDSAVLAASGGELRVLKIANAIAHGLLAEAVPGLDRRHLDLVLSAIAHAGGSHEHIGLPTLDPSDARGTTQERTAHVVPSARPLYTWPVDETAAR